MTSTSTGRRPCAELHGIRYELISLRLTSGKTRSLAYASDYNGFSSSNFAASGDVKSDPAANMVGPDGMPDRHFQAIADFERGVDYHLDFYDTSWWVFRDLLLSGCVEVEQDGSTGGAGVSVGGVEKYKVKRVKMRGREFSVPTRPVSCVEKLYGADWAVPKEGLNGVN